MPYSSPVPRDGQAVAVQRDVGAHLVEQVAQRVARPGSVYCGQPGHDDPAAGDRGRGQERGGVGQVRFDLDVECRPPARARPARSPASSSSTTTPTSRSTSTVISTCGSAGDRRADVLDRRRRRRTGRRPAAAPDTNWLDAEASIRTVPPRTAPVPWTVNGSAPGAVVVDPRRRGRAARPAPGPSGAAGPAGRRRSGPRRRPARRPAAGTASPCRPARSRSRRGRASPRDDQPVVAEGRGPGDVARLGRRARPVRAAISTVSRERSGERSRDGSSASAASTRYRLVSDFEPGRGTVASTGRSAVGAGHGGQAHARRG